MAAGTFLLQVLSYGENEFECRRVMMLAYFHERFDKKQCNLRCDNCRNKQKTEERDVTQHGKAMLSIIGASRSRLTLAMAVEALKGARTATVKLKGVRPGCRALPDPRLDLIRLMVRGPPRG
jgi:bloom syndrome protein